MSLPPHFIDEKKKEVVFHLKGTFPVQLAIPIWMKSFPIRNALDECHKEFNKQLDKEYEKVEKARQKILKYMSTNQRLERKQSHWPLELLEIAENLEENTIPKKEKKAK